jgi:hypothetical protein
MAVSNLSTQYISASFQNLTQISSSGVLYNGLGNQIGSLAVTESVRVSTTQSAEPAWTGKDGEIVPATVAGSYRLYVWMNGSWRYATLS